LFVWAINIAAYIDMRIVSRPPPPASATAYCVPFELVVSAALL
jgi:hypothetical protein